MNSVAYRYNRFDPGIFMELYLPKKAEYQGILYDTLTGGFLIENVRTHLKTNWEQIVQLMAGFYTSRIKTTDELNKLLPVFYGYSMYEVDGVFFNSETKRIMEERTQVIRLMFRFDIDGFCQVAGEDASNPEHKIAKIVADDYLRFVTDKTAFTAFHAEQYKQRWPQHEAFIGKVISVLENWELSLVMFILGYVVFEICKEIKFLHETTKRDPEEEIWITSFWNLRINRIVKDIETE